MPSRNESCPCGSKQKYKKCCLGASRRSGSPGGPPPRRPPPSGVDAATAEAAALVTDMAASPHLFQRVSDGMVLLQTMFQEDGPLACLRFEWAYKLIRASPLAFFGAFAKAVDAPLRERFEGEAELVGELQRRERWRAEDLEPYRLHLAARGSHAGEQRMRRLQALLRGEVAPAGRVLKVCAQERPSSLGPLLGREGDSLSLGVFRSGKGSSRGEEALRSWPGGGREAGGAEVVGAAFGGRRAGHGLRDGEPTSRTWCVAERWPEGRVRARVGGRGSRATPAVPPPE